MRSFVVHMAIIALSGCAARQPSVTEDYRQQLALYKNVPIVLPKLTPFDDDSCARAVYLDSYRDGYRSGLTGYFFILSFPPGPYQQARQRGWSDGQHYGLLVDEKKP
jgi:hypothetical protein